MQTTPAKPFPVTSMGKFTFMYFATAGYYSYYWFYRCWIAVQAGTGKPNFSVGRAAFAVLFVHELFAQVRVVERQRGGDYPWFPARLAWIFIGAAIAQFVLLYWALELQMGCWVRLAISVLVLAVQFYSLYQVQLVINRMEGDPFGKQNQRLSLQNHIWIILGFYIWFAFFRSCLTHQPVPIDPIRPVETAPPTNQIL
jgi:hypothetical protein